MYNLQKIHNSVLQDLLTAIRILVLLWEWHGNSENDNKISRYNNNIIVWNVTLIQVLEENSMDTNIK